MHKLIALAVILAGMTMLAESAPRPPWMTQLQTQNQNAEKADNLEREVLIQALLAMSRGNVASQHKLAENQQYPQRVFSQGLSAKNQQFPETTSQGRLPQYIPLFVQAASSRRPQSNEAALQAFGDPKGIEIVGCGAVGNIIESALRFGLGFIPGGDNNYGVYIQCPDPSYPCTTVQVAVPSGRNNMKADVDVCSKPGLYIYVLTSLIV